MNGDDQRWTGEARFPGYRDAQPNTIEGATKEEVDEWLNERALGNTETRDPYPKSR